MTLRLALAPKLTLLFVLFAALIITGLGSFAYLNGRSAILEATVAHLVSTALEKKAALKAWEIDHRKELVILSRRHDLKEKVLELTTSRSDVERADRLRRYLLADLQGWSGEDGIFQSLMIIARADGQVLVSSNAAETGTFKENRAYFLNGREAPHFVGPYYSVTLQEPTAVVSAPIRGANGAVIAVLAGRLKLSESNAIVARRTGLHDTDDAYLVNASHLLVTQPRLTGDPSVLRRGIYTPAMNRCIAGENGSEIGVDFRGVPVIAVYRWLAQRRLCLMVKIGEAEAFEDVFRLGKAILISAFLVLVSAVLVAALFARMITRPVLALQAGAAAVGRGDRSVRLPARAGDELGELGRQFNAMTVSLLEKEKQVQQYAEHLERRVEERTAELRAAQEDLVRKERLATLGQLTATVSHELRNPLGAMRTSIAVIKKLTSEEANPLLRDSVEIADRSIGRCDGIIADLLDYARTQPLKLEPTSIDDWLDGLLDDYELPPGVTLRRELDSGAEVALDRDRFPRAIGNLIDNACQAMAEDDGAGHDSGANQFVVATRVVGERVEISVRDSGPGISPDTLEKVFEPLFSTKSFGVGIGLPIVKRVVEQHGGGIGIESEPGRGTRVELWLPLAASGRRAA